MTKSQYFILILILGLLSTISPFSIDMYLPGFPSIAKDLNSTIDKVQLSLTSYFIGISLGQLLYGPLLDRFGRKRPLYIGLLIYVIASIGCAYTNSVEQLIFMRLIQAVGGCAGMVAAQALVRDLFPVEKTAQAFSLLVLVIAISPMIAPTLGGYMVASYGWHSVFLVLGAITAFILVAAFFALPEGQLADRTLSLKPKAVVKAYWTVLSDKQFAVYAFAGGIATSAPFAYIAGSSDVFMNIYQVTEKQYGWIFAILAFAMIGSTQLNHILLKYYSNKQVMKVAISYQVVTGVLMVGGVMFGMLSMYALIGLLFIFLTGHGLSNPNASALTLAPFSKNAGSASALMGAIRMGLGGLVTALVSVLHNGTTLPMVLVMALCAAGGLIILQVGDRKKRRIKREKLSDSYSQ
ncbi:multidrug effflux MFS transporter [Fulvivirga sediminis]|uniref:Multidrug effflux MFS transporter n=1 Tax=Fulvivirga sediminis TaxID=2803949 RepID=A0A937FBL4_9BACT|nr:multidrug effflux MFS transporter [Fulvivirga sediminis]MBL3658657.1 multidrug effflux MFS transporter [Fulvivirga sediminis]